MFAFPKNYRIMRQPLTHTTMNITRIFDTDDEAYDHLDYLTADDIKEQTNREEGTHRFIAVGDIDTYERIVFGYIEEVVKGYDDHGPQTEDGDLVYDMGEVTTKPSPLAPYFGDPVGDLMKSFQKIYGVKK